MIETRPPSVSDLLELMEKGWNEGLAQRALILLQALFPDSSIEELAGLSIGRRDSQLLKFREYLFGSQIHSLEKCPECGEKVELEFELSDISVVPPDNGSKEHHLRGNEKLEFSINDYEIYYRLPNSYDFIYAGESHSIEEARLFILQQCVLEVLSDGENVVGKREVLCSEKISEALVKQMEWADPQADVQLKLTCFSCDHNWFISFDVVSYLWKELEIWSQRILQDVHTLAGVYHWKESEILGMTPWRRQMYLGMINS